MRALSALVRLAGMLVGTVCLIPFALLARLLGRLGAERFGLWASARVQQTWGRLGLWSTGVTLDLQGRPPRGRYLVVANHLSYLDVFVLAVLFPGRFVAKSEIAGWPIVGFVTRIAGTLFVEKARRKDVVRIGAEMERTLARGTGILLFPEGGASRGRRVEPLKSSLLEPAARNKIPCLPVTLRYHTPKDPWTPASTVCWWGGMGLADHVRLLLLLGGIRARVRWAQEPLEGSDRKALTAALQHELESRFEPIDDGPLPPGYPWPELFPGEGSLAAQD